MPKLYGEVKSNNAISANAYHDTYEDRELYGWLEIYAIQVAPDFDPTDSSSHLDYLQLFIDKDTHGIYPMKCDYYNNMCPYFLISGFASRRDETLFLDPTVKVNKGRELVVRLFADSTGVDDTYYVRVFGLLYDEAEVRELFGLDDPDDFERRLEGGINQEDTSVMPLLRYGFNEEATQPGRPYDIEDLTIRIRADESLQLLAIGCRPHANQQQLLMVDHRTERIFFDKPLLTQGLQVGAHLNEAPVGIAADMRPPFLFPPDHLPTLEDTTLRVQILDRGVSVPAGGSFVWLKGRFTRTR